MHKKKGNDEKASASAEGAGGSGKRQSSRTIVVSRAMRVVSSEARLGNIAMTLDDILSSHTEPSVPVRSFSFHFL